MTVVELYKQFYLYFLINNVTVKYLTWRRLAIFPVIAVKSIDTNHLVIPCLPQEGNKTVESVNGDGEYFSHEFQETLPSVSRTAFRAASKMAK